VAPTKVLSMMMGVWFATTFPGDLLAGYLGSLWSGMAKPHFFVMIAAVAGIGGVMAFVLMKPLNAVFEAERPRSD